MKRIGWGWMLMALLVAASQSAWADHGHQRGHRSIGVYFGMPWPGYSAAYMPYYDQPYSAPQLLVSPAAPPVYIERSEESADAPQASWYYCRKPQGYYPYVRECPGGWQKVAPQAPSAQQ